MNNKIILFPSVNATASARFMRLASREAYDPAELFLAVWLGVWALAGALLCVSQFIGHAV